MNKEQNFSTNFKWWGIKENLKIFYNNEAKKYSETRKKYRKEKENILVILAGIFENLQKWEKIKILEFWCGSWRFASFLNSNFPWQFEYLWIDLSPEIISYAKKDNPNLEFKSGDISEIIQTFNQENFDLIVWTSSFQHIPSKKERSFLMKHFYRTLKYNWHLLMTNRTLSNRFKKKHKKAVLKALFISLITFNLNKKRDIFVPRIDKNWKIYERFYHFFSLEELKNLSLFSGFSVKICTYLDENEKYTLNESKSRSSLYLSTKTPIES